MNANANLYRPQVIEALQTLWRALPLRGVSDERGTLEDYCFALSDFSADAVRNTVDNLRKGSIEDASRDFCPKAPRLADYVRSEQARLDALSRPKAFLPSPVAHDFKDWRIIQREETERLSRAGFKRLAENIGQIEAITLARRRELPEGAVWFWAICEIWGKAA